MAYSQVYRLLNTCCMTHWCMVMAAAAEALIERVEPNWVISSTTDAASMAASDKPGPSWPNNSTHSSGSEYSSIF